MNGGCCSEGHPDGGWCSGAEPHYTHNPLPPPPAPCPPWGQWEDAEGGEGLRMQGAGWETFVEVRDKWGLHEHRSLRSQSWWSVDNKTTTNWIVTAIYLPMRKTGWSVRQHVRGGLLVPSVKRGFRWQSCWGWGCIENSGLGRRAGGFGHQQWCHGRWWGLSQTLGRRSSRPARALPVCPVVWWSLLTVFLWCPCDIGTACEK